MNSARPITLLLVDDHFVVRSGLCATLGIEPGLVVIAQAADGEEALLLYREYRPDVVIMDGRLPGMNGSAATAAILAEDRHARVLMLSVADGEEAIHRALEAGAAGYLLKSAPRDELIRAVRAVAAGEVFIPPVIARVLSERNARPSLTGREQEILALLAMGRANKEIAAQLDLAEITVRKHVSHLLLKLGAQDRTQAVTMALRRGLLELPSDG